MRGENLGEAIVILLMAGSFACLVLAVVAVWQQPYCPEPWCPDCQLVECEQPETLSQEMQPFQCELKPENFLIEDRNGTLYFYYVMGEMNESE